VPALSQRGEGQAPPRVARDVLLVALEPGGGGVVEDQVDVQLEQVDAVPEHLPLNRIAMLGEDVQRAVELVEGQVPGRRQPDPCQPALVTGELGARPSEALRGHRQQGGLVRCPPLLGRQPGGDRPADAEPGPELCDHVDDAEFEARLDLDPPVMSCRVCGRLAGVGVEHAADAAHQSLERGAVEAIGAAEAVHHPGLDVAPGGVADVLGEGVVAHHRAVLVPPPRGPKVHAHDRSVSRLLRRPKCTKSCAHRFQRPWRSPSGKKPRNSMPRRRRPGPDVPTDRKLRPGRTLW
jgi:hypothetical protein